MTRRGKKQKEKVRLEEVEKKRRDQREPGLYFIPCPPGCCSGLLTMVSVAILLSPSHNKGFELKLFIIFMQALYIYSS